MALLVVGNGVGSNSYICTMTMCAEEENESQNSLL